MKEVRFFYVPNASTSNELPLDEATHALRVLRLTAGDVIMLMEQGRIIERGDHEKLIGEQGKYYQLYTGAFELE